MGNHDDILRACQSLASCSKMPLLLELVCCDCGVIGDVLYNYDRTMKPWADMEMPWRFTNQALRPAILPCRQAVTWCSRDVEKQRCRYSSKSETSADQEPQAKTMPGRQELDKSSKGMRTGIFRPGNPGTRPYFDLVFSMIRHLYTYQKRGPRPPVQEEQGFNPASSARRLNRDCRQLELSTRQTHT